MHSYQLLPGQALVGVEFLLISFPQGGVLAAHAPATLATGNPRREAITV